MNNTCSELDEYDTVEGRVALLAEMPSSSESSKQIQSAQTRKINAQNNTACFDGYNSMPQLPLVTYSATENSNSGYEFLEKIKEENETEKWTCSNDQSLSNSKGYRNSLD